MFEDFSFEPARTPRHHRRPQRDLSVSISRTSNTSSPPPLVYEHSGSVSPTSSRCSPPTPTKKAPPTITELVQHLSNHSLKPTVMSGHKFYRDLILPTPPAEDEELLESYDFANSSLDTMEDDQELKSTRDFVRLQRQINTRLLASEGNHIKALERLVDDMVMQGEQCSVSAHRRSPPRSQASSDRSPRWESASEEISSAPSLSEDETLDWRRRSSAPVIPDGRMSERFGVRKGSNLDGIPFRLTKSWHAYTTRPNVVKNVQLLRRNRRPETAGISGWRR